MPHIVKQRVLLVLAAGLTAGVAAAAEVVSARATLVVGLAGNPTQIVRGPDNKLWFSDETDHAIGVAAVTQTSATVTGYLIGPAMPSGLQPGDVTAITPSEDQTSMLFSWADINNTTGGFGSISLDGSKLQLFPIQGAKHAAKSLVAKNGVVWWIDDDKHVAVRVERSLHITEYPLPTGHPGTGQMISCGDGVCVGESGFIDTHAAIAKITGDGKVAEYPIPGVGNAIGGITETPNGVIHFSDQSTNSYGELFPDGSIKETPLAIANSKPAGLTTSPDGLVHMIEAGGYRLATISNDVSPPLIQERPFNGHGTARDLVLFSSSSPSSYRLIGNYTVPLGGLCLIYFDITSTGPTIPPADLAITKTHGFDFDEESRIPGTFGSLIYRLTVTNVSNADCVGGFTITDPLPSQLRNPFVSSLDGDVDLAANVSAQIGSSSCVYGDLLHQITCTIAELLPAHAQRSIEIGFTIGPSVPANTPIENKAFVSANCDGNASNNASNVDVFQRDHGLLIATKSHYIDDDGHLVWVITAENLGDVPTAGPVKISDAVPQGAIVAGISASAFGASATCSSANDAITCQTAAPLAPGGFCRVTAHTILLPSNAHVVNVATASDGTFTVSSEPDVVDTDAQGHERDTAPVPVDAPPIQPVRGRH